MWGALGNRHRSFVRVRSIMRAHNAGAALSEDEGMGGAQVRHVVRREVRACWSQADVRPDRGQTVRRWASAGRSDGERRNKVIHLVCIRRTRTRGQGGRRASREDLAHGVGGEASLAGMKRA